MPPDLLSLQRLQLQSERRGIGRGLADLLEDTGFERKYAKKDFRVTKKDLAQARRRGLGDIKVEKKRGLREVGYQREDVKTTAERGREDFGTRLTNLITDFSQQARTQEQSAAAAGVTGGTFGVASAAARQAQFERARQPLDTELARLEEDTGTSLGRLSTSAHDIRFDASRGRTRLKQDVRHDIRAGRRDLGRTIKDIGIRRQRGRREAAIGKVEIGKQIGTLRR